IVLSALDRPEEGMALLRHALELALANDATWTAMRCYTNLANEVGQRDDVETAYAFDVAGVELADRAGYRAPWWFMRGHLVGYFAWTGRWDQADGLFDDFLPGRDDPAPGQ